MRATIKAEVSKTPTAEIIRMFFGVFFILLITDELLCFFFTLLLYQDTYACAVSSQILPDDTYIGGIKNDRSRRDGRSWFESKFGVQTGAYLYYRTG